MMKGNCRVPRVERQGLATAGLFGYRLNHFQKKCMTSQRLRLQGGEGVVKQGDGRK